MHFDNPIFILLLLVAGLLRWLSKRSDTTDQDPERPNVPDLPIPRGGETQTEEERVRRFLEALGQPPGSRSPPKVAPKRPRQMQPRMSPTLPRLTTVPPPAPPAPVTTVETSLPPLPIKQRVFTAAPALESGFEVRDFGAQTAKESLPPGPRAAMDQQRLILKLKSPQDLQNAMVLREIFGPPRSLQPLETLL